MKVLMSFVDHHAEISRDHLTNKEPGKSKREGNRDVWGNIKWETADKINISAVSYSH